MPKLTYHIWTNVLMEVYTSNGPLPVQSLEGTTHFKRKIWSLTHVQFALIWCWAASRPKWRIWHWSDSIITRLYFNYYHNPEWKHILNKVLLKSLLMPVSVEINHKTIKMLIQLIKPLTKSTLKYSASIPKSLWHTTNLIVNHQLEATYLLL